MRLPALLKRSRTDPVDASASLKRRWVSPEDLNVNAALLGSPLASPQKRLWAMLIDLALIGLGSNLSNGFFVLAGLISMIFWWRGVKARWAWAIVALALLMGAVTLVEDVRQLVREQQGTHPTTDQPPAHLLSVAPSTLPSSVPSSEASAALAEAEAETAAALASADLTEASASSPADDAQAHQLKDQRQRIKQLEQQLMEARAPKSFEWKRDLEYWWEQVGHFYIWAALYFTVLPVWWQGQTVGKRLLGLRMVELTDKPFTLPLAFKRFGGYAAGFVTLNLGFLQILWDSNRQGIQDKTAHTVVLDTRQPSRPAMEETSDELITG